MRLKLYVPELGKTINIQNIEGYFGSAPRLLFTCDKKYEWDIFNSSVVFIDKNRKEYFRSSWAKTYYRIYESDCKKPKVKIEVRDLRYKDLGFISSKFLEKQLKKVSNKSNFRLPSEEKQLKPTNNRLRWWTNLTLSLLRCLGAMMTLRRRCKFYKQFYEFYLKHLLIISPKLVSYTKEIIHIQSTAPT